MQQYPFYSKSKDQIKENYTTLAIDKRAIIRSQL
jgi:hypothetical protein